MSEGGGGGSESQSWDMSNLLTHSMAIEYRAYIYIGYIYNIGHTFENIGNIGQKLKIKGQYRKYRATERPAFTPCATN